MAQDSQFDLTLNAPDFSGLYRGLDLAAQGEIRISGDIQQPELDLNFDIAKLNFDTLFTTKMLISKVKSSDQQNIRGNLALKLAQFKLGDAVQLTQLQLNAKGDENHQLNLRSHKPAALNVDLQGSLIAMPNAGKSILKTAKFPHTLIGQFNADKPLMSITSIKNSRQPFPHIVGITAVYRSVFRKPYRRRNGHLPFKLQQADLRFLKTISWRQYAAEFSFQS